MKGKELKWTGSRVIAGEMEDDSLCVRTTAGRLLRLWKDVPLSQRASFFDRAFAETNVQESSTAVQPSFHKTSVSLG